jgi:DNA-directed RNA polymerase subunit alpha
MYLADAEASKAQFYDEDLERKADRRSQILKIPVTDFELSVRSRNCLNKMNIKTLGDLVQMTEQELLAHKNFGETSLAEVKQMLAQKGLSLGMGKIDRLTFDPQKKPDVNEDMLGRPITDLDLSVRSRNCVEKLNIRTIGDLVERSEIDLLATKNFGQTSLNEVKSKLSELGLGLRG